MQQKMGWVTLVGVCLVAVWIGQAVNVGDAVGLVQDGAAWVMNHLQARETENDERLVHVITPVIQHEVEAATTAATAAALQQREAAEARALRQLLSALAAPEPAMP